MRRMTISLAVLLLIGVPSQAMQGDGEQAPDCQMMLERVAAAAEESKPTDDQARMLDVLLTKAHRQASIGDEDGCLASAAQALGLLDAEAMPGQ